MSRNQSVVSLTALFCLASISAFGADNVKGMITSRTGETLIVKSPEGNVTVVLTDGTTTKDDRGLFGLGKEKMSSVVLIPGLKVDVDGARDEHGRVVAKTITVDGDDLETAEMIQSGLHPTAEQVAANVQAIANGQRAIAANQQDIAAHSAQLAAARGILQRTSRVSRPPRAMLQPTNRASRPTKRTLKRTSVTSKKTPIDLTP